MSNYTNPYQSFSDPGPYKPAPPPSGSWAPLWIVGGLSAVALLCCCGSCVGCGLYFHMIQTEVEQQLAANPVIQEHIGVIVISDLNFEEEQGANVYVFDLQGSKADGQAIVNIDSDWRIVSGTLTMDSGEQYDLLAAP